jgi:prephenate dehydrogenase/ferredoxin-fold anticodon binding domain-containing protein
MLSHIHIFGGARGIGRWFVERVFTDISPEVQVTIYDIDPPEDSTKLSSVAVQRIRYSDGYIEGIPAFSQTDVIVLAIPINALPETCAALFPSLPDGCLVLDMSSVQTDPRAVLESYATGRLSLLGMHPLFGPQVTTPVGQIVVLTGFQEADERHKWFQQMLAASGLFVQRMRPEEHDEAMLFIQVLPHFLLLTFAHVLVSQGYSFAHLLAVRTPPFTFFSAFTGRLLSGNALTYANIQQSAGATQVHTAIKAAVNELADQLGPEHPVEQGAQAIQSLGRPFSGTEISECITLSNSAITCAQQREQRLFILADTGTLCGLQRVDLQKTHIGIVREVQADRIIFEERSMPTPQSDRRYAVCMNEVARKQYVSRGIAFGKFRRYALLKRNIDILTDAELHRWLDKHLLMIRREITIPAPRTLTAAFYEHYLPQLCTAVVEVSFVERYQRESEKETVTLSITHRPDVATEEVMKQITFITVQIAEDPVNRSVVREHDNGCTSVPLP